MQMKSSKSWRKRVSIEKRDRKAMFNLFADFEGSGQLESTSWSVSMNVCIYAWGKDLHEIKK